MKPDWIENAGHLAELDTGDVVVAPDGVEWPIVDYFREPRFGFLVTASVEHSGNITTVDAEELEWIRYGRSGTNRWRWRPTGRGYPVGDEREGR